MSLSDPVGTPHTVCSWDCGVDLTLTQMFEESCAAGVTQEVASGCRLHLMEYIEGTSQELMMIKHLFLVPHRDSVHGFTQACV